MYVPVTTEDFDTWIKAESRTFETRCDVIIGNTTYRLSGSGLSGDIISMQWNNVVCSNDGLQIGTSCMDEFRMEYRNNNSIPSLMNSEIHPYVGLVIPHENTGDVTVWIPLGVFYVTNTETNDDGRTYTITAYDGMQKFMGNVVWADIGITEFPVNAWTLLTAIATHFGVTVSYDEVVYQLLSSDDYVLYSSDNLRLVAGGGVDANKNTAIAEPLEGTYRDYIGWIAGLVGANAHMGRSGDLVISRYTDYGYTIGRGVQHMGGAKINYGGAVTYTAIVSGTDSDPVYSSSRTGNAITYTNPFITTVELDRVCDALLGEDGITVTPCNVEWRSDPRIDAGDIVSVEGSDGNLYSVYVMDRTVTITGGLSETLNCYGETEIAKALNTSPLVTKLAKVAKVATDYASLINSADGVMTFIDNNKDGVNEGFIIHDADGNGLLKCTSGGLGFSNDNGLTYTNAITKEGVLASSLHVVRNGVEVMTVDENNDGFPMLRMRDNEGDSVLFISPYLANSSLADSDTGVSFNLYNASGSRIAYIGTVGDVPTGKITGASIYLGNGSTLDTESSATAGAALLVNGTSALLRLNHPVTQKPVFSAFANKDSSSNVHDAGLKLYDVKNGANWLSATALYTQSTDTTNTVFELKNVDTTDYAVMQAQLWHSSTYGNCGKLSFYNGTSKELFGIRHSGDDVYVNFYDGTATRRLTLQSFTLSGITYHVLGYIS